MITRVEISKANDLIRPYIRETPVVRLPLLDKERADVNLKLEQLQVTGSFKPRGVFNRVLSNTEPKPPGLIAASGGNAGLAVAYAGQRLGLETEIFVPDSIAPSKLRGLKDLNASVSVVGNKYADAYEASMERAATTGALVVHAYDQHEIAVGQGTLGLAIEGQLPEVDTVLVSVGGGGLYAGLASWFYKRTTVVPVEPQQCPTLACAISAGGPVDVPVSGVAQSSLGATRISQRAYDISLLTGAEPVLVTEDAIVNARRRLWNEARLVAEPGGVTALAAVLSGAYTPSKNEQICVVICGANAGVEGLEL